MPKPKRALMLRSIPLHRYTAHTIVDQDDLEKELGKIRDAEVSIDDQEFLAGVVCIAVPVRDAKGQRVAALAISAPLARMSLEEGLKRVPLLRASADQLTGTIDLEEAK